MTGIYRIRNTTKNIWAYVEAANPPTSDPNNPGDSVDLNSVSLVSRSERPSGLQFMQIDLQLGTDLTQVNAQLPLNTPSSIQMGDSYSVGSNSITFESKGWYRVSWSVCGQISGVTTSNRRRCLQTQLNRNSGTLIDATKTGGYVRTPATGDTCHASGEYVIIVAAPGETVAIHAEDTSSQSTDGITFTVTGGYLSIERII